MTSHRQHILEIASSYIITRSIISGSVLRVLAGWIHYISQQTWRRSGKARITGRYVYPIPTCILTCEDRLFHSSVRSDENQLGALKTREWKRRYQVAGVENAGRSGIRRRNGTCWTTNASRRAWQDMTTGHTVVFSSWRPWDTQWVLTLKHCVPQGIAAAAAIRMRRYRQQRQRQTRHYDMILWLYNLVVDFS